MIKYCSQYVNGGGQLILSFPKCEVTIRCIREYYKWQVHHSLTQTEGEPVRNAGFNRVENYRYLPEASQRVADIVAEYQEKAEVESEHDHSQCDHDHG